MTDTPFRLADSLFTQDWSNTGLITTNDDWSDVPSVIGYRGDDLTGSTGTDPQTIVAPGTGLTGVIDVNANQTNPNTFSTGGVAEFEITNPVVALNGSGTADAPFLLIHLNTTGVENVSVSYNLRDIDGSTDDAVQQVALQYRVGATGNFVNIPAGYVADASTGPSLATQVTPVSATLPPEAANQPQVQLRIITTNAAGNDESIGVDDINIAGTPIEGGGGTPVVSIAATDPAASEAGTDPGTFTITRTGDPSEALTVSYAVGGQATNGTDYRPELTGTATIAAGTASEEITITPIDDGDVEGDETVTLTLEDTADYDLGSSNSATVTIADNDVNVILTPIYEIQGAAQTSPLVGDSVITSGIVTATDSNGFYLQDPTGDDSVATSDGIFVFTSSSPTVAVGNEVQVEGSVSEFIPGGASTGNLSTTQISGSLTLTTLSTGNALPNTVTLGAGGRVPPSKNIDDDAFASFDPTTDGIDFFESLEAMRVTAQDVVAVAGTNRFGEIFGVVDNGDSATGLSDRGTLNISPDDFNPERIQIDEDTGILPGFELPLVDTGASLGDVTGVISYDFGNFQIQPTETFTATASGLQPEPSTLAPAADQLAVASYNVLNLDPNDTDGDTDVADGRFNAIAAQIANNLNSPDIIGLQEVQDNDGSVNSTVTAADLTLQTLADAITAAGGPDYEFIDNPFIGDDTNGGEPGGNIRTAFLYNPSRVDLVGGSVRTVTDPQDQQTNPNNPFFDSRLPLAADFQFNGQTVTVVDNHFSSKGGSAPILGVEQPFDQRQEDPTVNGSLDQRQAQAEAVNDFVENILAGNPDANVVVEGDLNEFEFVSPLEILEQNLTNLTETLPADERYTFIFQGNSQALDHILVSDSLAGSAVFDEVHVNAEFAETDQRASDHDPVLARLTLERPVGIVLQGGNGKDTLEGGAGDDRLSGGNGKDTLFGLAGDDFLAGDNGSDTLIGGPGDDTLTGGNGSDTFVLAAGEGTDTITDFQNGPDRIGLSSGLTFDQLSIAQGSGNTLIRITSSDEILANLTGVQSSTITSADFVTV